MLSIHKLLASTGVAEFDEKTYYRTYELNRQGKIRLTLRILSIQSKYRQGIAFAFSKKPSFKGGILLNGEPFIPQKGQRLFVIPVSLPEKAEIIMDLDVIEGDISLSNASDFLDDYPEMIEGIAQLTGRAREDFRGNTYASGFTAANLYGNAFWIEPISETLYRFHCNDHQLDDDFDDMVFELEIENLSHHPVD